MIDNITTTVIKDAWDWEGTGVDITANEVTQIVWEDYDIPYGTVVAFTWYTEITNATTLSVRHQLWPMVRINGTLIDAQGQWEIISPSAGHIVGNGLWYTCHPGTDFDANALYSGGEYVPFAPAGIYMRLAMDTADTGIDIENQLVVWHLKET